MKIDLVTYKEVREYVETLYDHSAGWVSAADDIIATIKNSDPGANRVFYVSLVLPLRAASISEARLTVAPVVTLTLVKHGDVWRVANY